MAVIRHVLLFSFRPDAEEAERRSMLQEFEEFPNQFPQMMRWQSGLNQSKRDQTYSHAMTVEFGSFAELNEYLDSERHERFVTERFRPLVAQRAIVTFEVKP